MDCTRRRMLASGAWALAAVDPARLLADEKSTGHKVEEPEEEISAPEDLMREHGVLNRILLVYEEGLRRLRAKQEVGAEVFERPARLVRSFVEDYHERLEEKFIFPHFDKHPQLAALAAVLRQQHEAGRRLTDVVLSHAGGESFRKPEARQAVTASCEAFIRMYRPHEAREDTVLFPALYSVLGHKQVQELGEQFESEEHRLFGEGGFEKAVDQVAAVEKQLGIYELAAFTPR
jgi:hemerythrin-like domain-containing protein